MKLFRKIFFGLCLSFLINIIPLVAFAKSNLTIMPISSPDWGDATLLESNGEYLLIDVTYGETRAVLDFLDSNNIKKLDLYLSHYHSDHYGIRNKLKIDGDSSQINLIEYMIRSDDYDIGTLYLPDDTICKKISYSSCNNLKENLVKVAEDNGVQVVILTTGSKFTLGSTTAEVLYINNDETILENNIDSLINNSSLVTMFTNGKTKFLTAGDIEQITENKILEEGIDISADIFKLNHHAIQIGGEISNTKNFIDYVNPKYSYFQFNMNEYSYNYNSIKQSIQNLSNFSNIYTTNINGNIKFVIEDDVITPVVEKNNRVVTINYIDNDSKIIIGTKKYSFNYKLYDDVVEYHLYDFDRNIDGYVINGKDSEIQTSGVLESDVVYNLYYNKIKDELWVSFVEKFKETGTLEEIEKEDINIEITYTTDSLKIITSKNKQEYTTNFTYKDGILTYVPSNDEISMIGESSWVLNSLYAVACLYNYNIEELNDWLELNKENEFTLEKDGVEFKFTKIENEDEPMDVFSSFRLDIRKGLSKFNNEATKSEEKVNNPNTGINFCFGILSLIIIISGVGYFIIRRQSKFPKHN